MGRREPIRPPGCTAIVHRRHRHLARVLTGPGGPHPRLAPDLRRRRLVVLRPEDRTGRPPRVPSHALRLPRHRHAIRRADVLPARRHPLHQPARRAGGAAALDRHSVPPAPGQGEGAVRRARRACVDRRAARPPGGTQARVHRSDPAARARAAHVGAGRGGRSPGRTHPGPAQPGELHHGMARVPDDHVGRHGERSDQRARRGARLHQGDGGLRRRPPHGACQPRAHRRRLLRPVAGPPATALGAPRRDAAGLRLRRVDGRVDPRLRRRLGGGVGAGAPQFGAVPQPGLHRRCDVRRGRGRRDPGRASPSPGGGARDADQSGRRGDGKGDRDRGVADRGAGGRRRAGGPHSERGTR